MFLLHKSISSEESAASHFGLRISVSRGGNSYSIYIEIIKSESPMFRGITPHTVNILIQKNYNIKI